MKNIFELFIYIRDTKDNILFNYFFVLFYYSININILINIMIKRSSRIKTALRNMRNFLGTGVTTIKNKPPFLGTIYMDPDIITEKDPTTFTELIDAVPNQAVRSMFDRRTNSFNNVNAYLFNAKYSDSLNIEVQVNPEFELNKARKYALQYAIVIGRLPKALRLYVETVWIHDGVYPFGGGNNNLLIHVGQGEEYIKQNILEETFVHEASHTSLDPQFSTDINWITAKKNDPTFISTYAQDNPDREDIAESFLPYLAVTYRLDRITTTLANTIRSSIPNRIQYFDNLKLDMSILNNK